MSKFYTKAAEDAAAMVLESFEDPTELPEALKNIVLATGGRHSDNYSVRNQMIVAIMGYSDAAGYRQWLNKYGCQVRRGEKAFAVLAPVTKSFKKFDEDKGEEVTITYITGWRDVKVFGQEQCDVVDEVKWGKHMAAKAKADEHIERLPWTDVAAKWGLTVTADGGLYRHGVAGCYAPKIGIKVAVENLSTWAHELVHASDDRLGNLDTDRRNEVNIAEGEIVAEIGGAVLLLIDGLRHEADLGGAWSYVKRHSTDPIKDAGKLLDRIVAAVSLILEQADDPDNVIGAVAS